MENGAESLRRGNERCATKYERGNWDSRHCLNGRRQAGDKSVDADEYGD
jgi:hypothetical protein